MKLMLFSIAVLCVFIGCKKVDQAIPQSKCKITRLYTQNWEGNELIANVSYTSWGAPKAIQLEEEQTGQESYFFQYDANRNLTGFIIGYTPAPGETDTTFMFYHKYIYKNGKIVGDSLAVMGSVKDPIINNENRAIGKYTYDQFGRVIKYEAEGGWYEEPYVEYYNYPNENPYIKNTNFLGTHPVLMFVGRNYNRKNANVQSTNQYGLPTAFKVPYQFKLLQIYKIEYECNQQGKP